MAGRTRNIPMKFWVTEEEKRLIDQKMKQLPTHLGRHLDLLRRLQREGYETIKKNVDALLSVPKE